MSYEIRKLNHLDLNLILGFTDQKLEQTKQDPQIFNAYYRQRMFNMFVLPEDIHGADNYECFGYFVDNKLEGIIGTRSLREWSAWILSFIFTQASSGPNIAIIKSLVEHVIKHQESKGVLQWYVISEAAKFKAWQRLFKGLRSTYHHYKVAEVTANQPPKKINLLSFLGNKIFSYDVYLSLYISKSLCTSEEEEDAEN